MTKRTKTYSVLVTEHFVTRFTLEAESKEAAREQAEELAVNLSFEGAELLECSRTSVVEE